jgi:phage baseplate assembly protein V
MTDFKTLYRRTMMMLGIGKVTMTSDTGGIQQVQYETPLEVRGNTPRLMDFGFSSSLPEGSDVLIAYLSGDRSNAVVIASGHKASRHSNLKSGETVLYNLWGQFIKLTENGIEIEANGQAVTVSNATQVTINAADGVDMNTPLLKVSGDIVDNAGTNSKTLKNLRDTYNEHHHAVSGVQSGNAKVTSDTPGEEV